MRIGFVGYDFMSMRITIYAVHFLLKFILAYLQKNKCLFFLVVVEKVERSNLLRFFRALLDEFDDNGMTATQTM
jgi:hypothetical protein